jgi:deoxyribodipyrimidine photo-lyase
MIHINQKRQEPSAFEGSHAGRISHLNTAPAVKGEYILYWMQQSQRAHHNHALEMAVDLANRSGLGVLVGFGLTDGYPEANLRHFTFMLEGLRETGAELAKRGIKMVVRRGNPDDIALALGRKAAAIVCDRGYLRHQKTWYDRVAREAGRRVVQVESDVVAPVAAVSEKAEYAARTIRPRIHKRLEGFLRPLRARAVKHPSLDLPTSGLDIRDIPQVLKQLKIDRSVPAVGRFFTGGMSEARKRFDRFLKGRLDRYEKNSNQPQTDDISHMAPYLHFGQISPLYLALRVLGAKGISRSAADAFLEQLIVRRELAINFVNYTPDYDAFTCLPEWARKTLGAHRRDHREHLYSRAQLEGCATHDPYWNAAMLEMKVTGFMHNYMRMYWGKKILEWSPSPREAFDTALFLNNRYFLDGRDPNSFAGVSWIFGMHDRAWPERPVFGKIRYMAASGLERKCDIEAYVRKVRRWADG